MGSEMCIRDSLSALWAHEAATGVAAGPLLGVAHVDAHVSMWRGADSTGREAAAVARKLQLLAAAGGAPPAAAKMRVGGATRATVDGNVAIGGGRVISRVSAAVGLAAHAIAVDSAGRRHVTAERCVEVLVPILDRLPALTRALAAAVAAGSAVELPRPSRAPAKAERALSLIHI